MSRTCFLHPHTPAVAECTACRQPVCEVCLTRINSKPYCEHCAVNLHQQSPFWAGVFSALVPGLGQVYNGDWLKGVVIFLTGWLVLPWLYGIIDAVLVAHAIANGERESSTIPPGYIVAVLKVGVPVLSCAYAGLAWAAVSAFLFALQHRAAP